MSNQPPQDLQSGIEPVVRFELLSLDQVTRRATVRVTTYNGIGQIMVMEVGAIINVNLPVTDTDAGKVVSAWNDTLAKMKGE